MRPNSLKLDRGQLQRKSLAIRLNERFEQMRMPPAIALAPTWGPAIFLLSPREGIGLTIPPCRHRRPGSGKHPASLPACTGAGCHDGTRTGLQCNASGESRDRLQTETAWRHASERTRKARPDHRHSEGECPRPLAHRSMRCMAGGKTVRGPQGHRFSHLFQQ